MSKERWEELQPIDRFDIYDGRVKHPRWFWIEERRGYDDQKHQRAAYIGSGSVHVEAALSTLAWLIVRAEYHDPNYAFVVFANNQTEVQQWLLDRGYPVWGPYQNLLQPEEDRMRLNPQADRLRRQAERLLEKADFYDNLPEEPDNEPAVLYFERNFGGSKNYTYAAVKADGLWYTTGPHSPKGYTWEQLVRWLYEDDHDIEVWVAGDLTPIA